MAGPEAERGNLRTQSAKGLVDDRGVKPLQAVVEGDEGEAITPVSTRASSSDHETQPLMVRTGRCPKIFMSFSDPAAEQEFRDLTGRTLKFRCMVAGLLYLMVILFNIAHAAILKIGSESWDGREVLFMCSLCSIGFLSIALIFIGYIRLVWIREVTVAVVTTVIFCASALIADSIDGFSEDHPFHYFSIRLEVSIFLATLLYADGTLPIRAAFVFLGHLLTVIICTISMAVSARGIGYYITVTSHLMMIACAFFGAFTRWLLEKQQRELFFKCRTSDLKLRSLEQERQETQATGLEELVNKLEAGKETLQNQVGMDRQTASKLIVIFDEAIQSATRRNFLAAEGQTKDPDTAVLLLAYGVNATPRELPLKSNGNHFPLMRGQSNEGRLGGIDDMSPSRNVRYSLQTSSSASEYGWNWHLNLQKLNEMVDGRVMMEVALNLLAPFYHCTPVADAEETFSLGARLSRPRAETAQFYEASLGYGGSGPLEAEPHVLPNFVAAIEADYKEENPYHNRLHAAQVMHATTCLIRMLEVEGGMTQIEQVAAMVAGLCHDVGHPGRNNAFLINTNHDLAVVYNDRAVLESYHAATTFKTLNRSSCDIFACLPPEDYKHVRNWIIELILATDMGRHMESISFFRVRQKAADFNYRLNSDDALMVAKMCLKMGDLSHVAFDWNLHLYFSNCIAEEFYAQGDEEEILGLPKSALCAREQHANFPKSQVGFIEFVVSPLALVLNELPLNERMKNQFSQSICVSLEENLRRWQSMLPKPASPPLPSRDDSKIFGKRVSRQRSRSTARLESRDFGRSRPRAGGNTLPALSGNLTGTSVGVQLISSCSEAVVERAVHRQKSDIAINEYSVIEHVREEEERNVSSLVSHESMRASYSGALSNQEGAVSGGIHRN